MGEIGRDAKKIGDFMEKIAIIGLGMVGYELVKKYMNLEDYSIYTITRTDKGFFKEGVSTSIKPM